MLDTAQFTLDIEQSIDILAPLDEAYAALIRRLTLDSSTPDNKPMPMKLEEWPGGRWYRDLGEKQGHFWGTVQVIKPPTLIEIYGPMFMSYAVAGHLQLRLIESDSSVELYLRHQVFGLVKEDHRKGLTHGWDGFLTDVNRIATQ